MKNRKSGKKGKFAGVLAAAVVTGVALTSGGDWKQQEDRLTFSDRMCDITVQLPSRIADSAEIKNLFSDVSLKDDNARVIVSERLEHLYGEEKTLPFHITLMNTSSRIPQEFELRLTTEQFSNILCEFPAIKKDGYPGDYTKLLTEMKEVTNSTTQWVKTVMPSAENTKNGPKR